MCTAVISRCTVNSGSALARQVYSQFRHACTVNSGTCTVSVQLIPACVQTITARHVCRAQRAHERASSIRKGRSSSSRLVRSALQEIVDPLMHDPFTLIRFIEKIEIASLSHTAALPLRFSRKIDPLYSRAACFCLAKIDPLSRAVRLEKSIISLAQRASAKIDIIRAAAARFSKNRFYLSRAAR